MQQPIDPTVLDRVLDRLSDGETIVAACRAEKVSRQTFYSRVAADTDFARRAERAKAAGIDVLAHTALTVAADGSKDRVEGVVDHEHINRSRLYVETLKWFLSKLAPKVYGDKLGLDHSGGLALQVLTGVPHEHADDNDDLA